MITHRYVGIVIGLLMLLWFLSGVVMLFVHWPEVRDEQRVAGLAPITWTQCCKFGQTQDVQIIVGGTVEDLAGRPVLRADGEVTDLTTGLMVHEVSAADAAIVASNYARAAGIGGQPGTPELVKSDQWTVTGYFNKRRPFWTFHFDDPKRTDIYVSAHTGVVAQVTDRPTRILNWLGPIPHWLYPAILRADTKLWSQVVIWTSIIGIFLTVTGLYLGIVSWRPWRDDRLTPYRGLMAWHHLTGLAAGLLTLTWVASGLVSMNPWGFLEGEESAQAELMTGDFIFGDLTQGLLAAKAAGVTARQIKAAPLADKLYLMADGVRLDATAKPASLAPATLADAAKRLGPIRSQGLITEEDTYYYGHHEPVVLPAYRVEMMDGVRFYLDPKSGHMLSRVDATARSYRWLFEGLHRLDFVRGLDRGAGWATAMVILLIFAGGGVATGVWLGWRRAKSDVAALLKRKAPKLG